MTTEKLTEPIVNGMEEPIIQFAGEATNEKHYACVHGAIDTGWREADRLIELYKWRKKIAQIQTNIQSLKFTIKIIKLHKIIELSFGREDYDLSINFGIQIKFILFIFIKV